MPDINGMFKDLFDELRKPIIEKKAERLALSQLLYYYPDMFEHKQQIWQFQYDKEFKGFLYIGGTISKRSLVTANTYRKYLQEGVIEA